MVSNLESEVDCSDSNSSCTQQDGFWWRELHELVQRQWQSLVKPVYAISNAPRWRASVSWLIKMLANTSSCRRQITNTALTTSSMLHNKYHFLPHCFNKLLTFTFRSTYRLLLTLSESLSGSHLHVLRFVNTTIHLYIMTFTNICIEKEKLQFVRVSVWLQTGTYESQHTCSRVRTPDSAWSASSGACSAK